MSLDALDHVEASSRPVRRTGQVARVVDPSDSIGIQFARSSVRGPQSYRDAMKFVASRQDPFEVGSLPGLESSEPLSFARQLVRAGC